MILYGYGNLNEEPDTEQAAKTGLRYPNLFSVNGKHLLGTQLDWLGAFWGGTGQRDQLVIIGDDFFEPIMLLRDMRGIMNYYLQTHTIDCGKEHCWNCIKFVRK